MHRLADLILARRRDLNLTAIAVARGAGVTRSYLSMIENNKIAHPPSENVLRRLELALQLDNNELLTAAVWERTPDPIRKQFNKTLQHAQLGKKIADWLQQSSAKRDNLQGVRDLDALFASGELTQHIIRELDNETHNNEHKRDTHNTSSDSDEPTFIQKNIHTNLPLINFVPAGTPTDFTDLDYPAHVADDYLPRPADIDDPHAFAARIVGQSMAPDYQPGDLVIFSPSAKTPEGSDCFVRLEPDHQITFKRIFFEDHGNIIKLVPLNSKYEIQHLPCDQIAGLYRAVWKMQRLT